jgi:hypothetical protein
MRLFWVSSLLLMLAACSTEPACLREQPYQNAEAFPPLRAPAGMTVPEPDPNLEVAEVEDGPVAAFPAEEGDGSRRCLSMPPPLPEKGKKVEEKQE